MKVLNFGSLNIDYVYNVDSFVLEGETKSSLGYMVNAGGKGLNQSVALSRAGFDVYHFGKIGAEGVFLKKLLEESGVNTSKILQCNSATGHAIIQIDAEGKNCILLHGGSNMEISKEEIDCALTDFSSGDLLVLQNEVSNIGYAIDKAYEKGMKIAINVAPVNGNEKSYDLKKASVIVVNETEGRQISKRNEISAVLEWLETMYPKAVIVLTLGSDGSICHFEGKSYTQGVMPAKVVDTTSAGDTFFGYFLKTYSESGNIPDALLCATKASSICVSRAGSAVSIPHMSEVK